MEPMREKDLDPPRTAGPSGLVAALARGRAIFQLRTLKLLLRAPSADPVLPKFVCEPCGINYFGADAGRYCSRCGQDMTPKAAEAAPEPPAKGSDPITLNPRRNPR